MKTTCNTPVIAVTPKGRFIFPYFMSVSSVSFVRSKIIIGFSFLQSPHVSIILLNYIIVASNVQNRFVIKRKADGNGFETYCPKSVVALHVALREVTSHACILIDT